MLQKYITNLTRLTYEIYDIILYYIPIIILLQSQALAKTYPFFVSHQVQVSLGLCVSRGWWTPQGEAYARIGPRHDRQWYDVLDDYQKRPVSKHRVFRQVDVETVRPVVRVVYHPKGICHRRTQHQANDPDERDHAHALSFRRPRATNKHKTIPLLISL